MSMEKWTAHEPGLMGAPEVRDQRGMLVATTYPVPLTPEFKKEFLGATDEEIEKYLASPEATDFREATERANRIADLPDMERDIRWLLKNFDSWLTEGQWRKLDHMKKKYGGKKRC